MIIAFFIYCSNAVIGKCLASPKVAAIPSSYDLVQYYVVINSGSHSPRNTFLNREKRGFWNCDSQNSYSTRTNVFPVNMPRSIHSILDKRYSEYPPNCVLNDLTVEGSKHVHDLGLEYHKNLISINTNFFSDAKISQRFQVRATYEDNSFRNAVSFLTGLFNDSKVDDIEIITGTKSNEIIIANEKYCKDIKKLISDYEASDEYKQIISQAKKELNRILTYLNFDNESIQNPTRSQIINVCDFVLSMYCNEQIIDLNITNDLYKKIGIYYTKLSFDSLFTKSKIGVGASSIMREIMRTINSSIENKNYVKFSLFSGDDSSIAAILSLMKKNNEFIPLASHISFAVLKKDGQYYLQIALNGKSLESPFNDKSIFSYNGFINYVNNYIDFCH